MAYILSYSLAVSEISTLTALTQELKQDKQQSQNRIDQLEGELALAKGELFVLHAFIVSISVRCSLTRHSSMEEVVFENDRKANSGKDSVNSASL